jgi:hypothetical protein
MTWTGVFAAASYSRLTDSGRVSTANRFLVAATSLQEEKCSVLRLNVQMSLSAETKEKRFELEFNNWDISRARNGPVYQPELIFVPEFHTGTCQFIMYPFIFFHFSDGISLFRF